MKLPVLASVRQAYVLLWRHRALHAKAIWPPIVFLVAAEFLFHKVIGNADDVRETSDALERASYWSLAAIALLWLAGLKFLLSFSISWRRHILLGEKFDPFFFKKPFWKYLILMIYIYFFIVSCFLLSVIVAFLLNTPIGYIVDYLNICHDSATCPKTLPEGMACDLALNVFTTCDLIFNVIPLIAVLFLSGTMVVWWVCSNVPRLTAIAVGNEFEDAKESSNIMRRKVMRYLAVWVMAMGPIFALAWLLTLINSLFDIDVSSTPVALGESAFRQACLFVHFSLGASIGAITYQALVKDQGPETIS
jgi:hypothetical protein